MSNVQALYGIIIRSQALNLCKSSQGLTLSTVSLVNFNLVMDIASDFLHFQYLQVDTELCGKLPSRILPDTIFIFWHNQCPVHRQDWVPFSIESVSLMVQPSAAWQACAFWLKSCLGQNEVFERIDWVACEWVRGCLICNSYCFPDYWLAYVL